MVHVDPDPHHCVRQTLGVGSCFNQNAPGLARANQEIVGPAQIDLERGDGADGIGCGQARSQRQKRQGRGGEPWPKQHAHVEAFADGGDPSVIATAAARQLLVAQVDRAVRRSQASRGHGVTVGRAGDAGEMQLACEECACDFGFKGCEIEHEILLVWSKRLSLPDPE